MDKYKKLMSNTVIFAIGTFSSKLLVFVLMRLYTWAMTTEEFGMADLIIQTGDLLLPLASIGIANSIIRFGLDKNSKKSDVFSTGLISILGGFTVLFCFWPLLDKISIITGKMPLIYAFLLMSCLRTLCSQFVRSRGLVKLFAFDGILATITTIIFNIVFLVTFKWGVTGYVMSIVLSDFLSIIFLFMVADLKKYIKFRGISKHTAKNMIKYAVPMIPTSVCWWVTNVSDRYLVSFMIGASANGLYAAAAKLPTAITLVSNIFMDAWQMSAITEEEDREKFFSKVFKVYCAIVFVGGSAMILLSKTLISLLAVSSYYEAWKYIPFLVLATVFNCFGMYMGSVYVVEKKSTLSLVTTLTGAIVNIGLNILLIPLWGVNGAAFSTFISYFIIFIFRTVTSRKYIKIKLNVFKLTINGIILSVQSVVMISEMPYWLQIEIVLFVIMTLINFKDVLEAIVKLFVSKRIKK